MITDQEAFRVMCDVEKLGCRLDQYEKARVWPGLTLEQRGLAFIIAGMQRGRIAPTPEEICAAAGITAEQMNVLMPRSFPYEVTYTKEEDGSRVYGVRGTEVFEYGPAR